MNPISLVHESKDGVQFYMLFNYESKELKIEKFETANENKLNYLRLQSLLVLLDSFMSRELILRPEKALISYMEGVNTIQRFHVWAIQEPKNKSADALKYKEISIIPEIDKIMREIGPESMKELFIIRTLISNI